MNYEKEVQLLELFYSIDGETKRSGELVWFIRLNGCNLKCIYCDTAFSQDGNANYEKVTIQEIINRMSTNSCKKVTITGGEPLIHQNIKELVWALYVEGYDINIETNGTLNPYKILDPHEMIIQNGLHDGEVWFSMDYKSKYSGMQKKMLAVNEMARALTHTDCLKFVVANEDDLNDTHKRIIEMENWYDEMNLYYRPTYYISPCFNQIKLDRIIEFMKEKELVERVKFQIQLHKIVWDPNKRGV